MNLRQGVEYGAGRLVKLDGAAHFERARQNLFGTLQIAELDVDLAERGEGDRQSVPGSERLIQGDAPLRERERFFMTVPHQRDIRLVVHDSREDVVRMNGHRETLTLA